MQTGLVSVTFRDLPPSEVIQLVKDAGLDGIEWGADVHCPPNNLQNAKEIARQTHENGLKVISYGSYYYANSGEDFTNILNTAVVLQTDNIRIWAGGTGSQDTTEETRAKITEDIRKVADMAAAQGISISFEYHCDTLTDTLDSTIRLLQDVNRPNAYTYWQKPDGSAVEENVNELQTLIKMNKLKNLHIFSHTGYNERHPFSQGADEWAQYISVVKPANPALLFEFVKDDSPEQFIQDARFLKSYQEIGKKI